MDYTIDIIDTVDESLVTSVERALSSSIILEWQGGDHKDELFVMGSSLSFTMLGMSRDDAQYQSLFTGDETRFRVKLYDEEKAMIWQGFLLPDAYSEPYQNAPIPIKFKAVDGLGRLKGKYLPEDFYKEEKSVIQILSKCLELTGLGIDLRFAPAIENSQQKDYRSIYLDTSLFKDNDKKQDAYKILDDLLKSMVCTLYQVDNYYNIEGFNIRNFASYDAKIYYPNSTFKEDVTVDRLEKDITALDNPMFNLQPPYGIIDVRHKREPLELPDGLSNVENDGWASREGETVYALDWIGHNGQQAIADGDGGQVHFDPHNSNLNISLKKRPYLIKGKKYRLKLNFKLISDYDTEEKEAAINDGLWDNPFDIDVNQYDVSGNVITLCSNNPTDPATRNIPQDFDEDGEKETSLQLTALKSGTLDIEIKGKSTQQRTGIQRIEISEVSLEEIAHEDEYISEVTSSKDYTVKKEIAPVYADDATGFSKAFRLQKLNSLGVQRYVHATVNRQYYMNGWWYASVDLKTANLVDHNRGMVFNAGNKIYISEVIYNINNSDEHALKINDNLFHIIGAKPSIEVRINDFNTVHEDRGYWEQWGDVKYQVERKRYCDSVADIYSRLSNTPIFTLDARAKNNIKINDFVNFNFAGQKQFMLTSCKWDIDKGISYIIGTQAHYGAESGQNQAPVVEAGEDIYLESGTTTAQLTCEAYDPDGDALSYQWELVEGTGSITNPTSQNTEVTGLSEDTASFSITVTDSEGNTASDMVYVIGSQSMEASLELKHDNDYQFEQEKAYYLRFDPELSSGSAVNVSGTMEASITGEGGYMGRVVIEQNGQEINRLVTYTSNPDVNGEFSINMIPGDEIVFTLFVIDNSMDEGSAEASFSINAIDFAVGLGTVTGLPLSESISI